MTVRAVFVRLACAMLALLPLVAFAQAPTSREETEAIIKDYLARHPEEVQRIVKDYLISNPDVLQQVLMELIKKQQPNVAGTPPSRPDKSAEVRANAKLLFDSPRQVVLGNPQGDVTLVEFFDYNCGFCKRALADKLALLKDDPKLRFVLKELPILGPGSTEAARIAVAVRLQDPTGARYAAFHERMLSDRSPAGKAQAIAHAAAAGLDMARLERDLASSEIDATLQESATLARTLGISGTPSYVVGDAIVAGAVGAAALKQRIAAVRSQRPG
jgi:protein-disulfide isomerase